MWFIYTRRRRSIRRFYQWHNALLSKIWSINASFVFQWELENMFLIDARFDTKTPILTIDWKYCKINTILRTKINFFLEFDLKNGKNKLLESLMYEYISKRVLIYVWYTCKCPEPGNRLGLRFTGVYTHVYKQKKKNQLLVRNAVSLKRIEWICRGLHWMANKIFSRFTDPYVYICIRLPVSICVNTEPLKLCRVMNPRFFDKTVTKSRSRNEFETHAFTTIHAHLAQFFVLFEFLSLFNLSAIWRLFCLFQVSGYNFQIICQCWKEYDWTVSDDPQGIFIMKIWEKSRCSGWKIWFLQ